MTLLFRPPHSLSHSFYTTKTATVTLSRALFLSPSAFLKYRNGILFAAVRASKRLFVIIQIYAVIQGHLYHFKLFGCSSSGAGQTIPLRPEPLAVSFCALFLCSSPPPTGSETVMIVTASKSSCCGSAKTKWDLVGCVCPGFSWRDALLVQVWSQLLEFISSV